MVEETIEIPLHEYERLIFDRSRYKMALEGMAQCEYKSDCTALANKAIKGSYVNSQTKPLKQETT